MGDLTHNLSRSEFECSCDYPECTSTPVDFHLINGLQMCVDYFMEQSILDQEYADTVERVAIHINSGHRCPRYDRAMKKKNKIDYNGIKLSQHTWGGAADFWLEYILFERDLKGRQKRIRIHDDLVADYLEAQYSGRCGIGRYDGRTHFDVRSSAARWDNRGKH